MTVVRNVFSDWNTSVCCSASVDSALAGNHDDASLFSSSVILEPKPNPSTIVTPTQKETTAHVTLRPQTAPAILLVIARPYPVVRRSRRRDESPAPAAEGCKRPRRPNCLEEMALQHFFSRRAARQREICLRIWPPGRATAAVGRS